MKKLTFFISSTIAVLTVLGFSIGVVEAGTCELPFFDNSSFGIRADNPYLSTDSIGYTYVYEAETDEGLVRDFQYFNTSSKTILGVNVIEVYDVEYLYVEDLGKWVILEETWDWHDWDNFGNFWYFGEDTLAYEWNDDWTCYATSTVGSWEAGPNEADAKPGIILLADPKPGDCVLQEFYEEEAEDRGKVLRLNGNACDYCDNDCLVTKEWTKLDPGNVEHKYYRPYSGTPGEVSGLVYIEELKEKTVIFELVGYYFGPPDTVGMDFYPLPSLCQ